MINSAQCYYSNKGNPNYIERTHILEDLLLEQRPLKNNERMWHGRDSITGKMLSFIACGFLGSNPSTLYGFLSPALPRVIHEHRAKSKPFALLSVALKTKQEKKTKERDWEARGKQQGSVDTKPEGDKDNIGNNCNHNNTHNNTTKYVAKG